MIRTELLNLNLEDDEEVERVLLDKWAMLRKLDLLFKERGARAYISLTGEEQCLVHCGKFIEYFVKRYKKILTDGDPNKPL